MRYLSLSLLLAAPVLGLEDPDFSPSEQTQGSCDAGCTLTKILSEDKEFDYGGGVDQNVKEYAKLVRGLVDSLQIDENVTRFDEAWFNGKARLTDMLTELPPIQGLQIENTRDNFGKLLHLVLRSISKRMENLMKRQLIKLSAIIALKLRADTKDLTVDKLKILPYLDATSNVVDPLASDYRGEDWHELTPAHDRRSRVVDSEKHLNYFREDDALHIFHNEWHAENYNRQPSSRAGERFFYMHKQLLVRYQIERKILGMPDVVPLDARNRDLRFSSRYYLSLQKDPERRLVRFARATDTCRLTNQQRRELRRREARCDQSMKYGMNEFRKQCEMFHNYGHVYISLTCKENWGPSRRGIMTDSAASARDPLFYRWHLAVDRKYDTFLKNEGSYKIEELRPPQGITVDEVSLQSRCPKKNIVETIWKSYGGNKYRLDHEAFTVTIRLKNERKSRDKVIVRLFLFLEEYAARAELPIELDRFVHTLTGSTTETIHRADSDSSLVMQGTDDCGWPKHLLLPKGKTSKKEKGELTPFRLVAVVHRPTSRNVNIGTTTASSQILCGSLSNSGVVGDEREEGFPFNRAWPVNIAEAINNNNREFGNISAKVYILNVGRPTRECELPYDA